MRRDSVAVLFARGWVSAFATWKGLLVALLLNVALALAVAQPVASALHGALDRSGFAERVAKGDLATFYDNFSRNLPGVVGSTRSWETLLSGGALKSGFFDMTGASGTAVWAGIAMAFLSALLAAGFAGRFGAETDRGSLALFGADVARFGLPSLLLGVLSFAGIVAAYRWVYAATADLTDVSDLRYEWEAVGLTLGRLLLFLLVAAALRLVVLYARAFMGLRRSANPALALARSVGFLAGRPLRALTLEILFGIAGLLPLVLWVSLARSWDGADPATLVLVVLGQQVVVLLRVAARAAHLGAATAFLRRAAESATPARREEPRPAGPLVPGPAADPSEG